VRPARQIAILLALAVLASSCGQRGDLYLRDNPPPGVRGEKPPAYKPVPYPKEAAEEKAAGEAKK
jgi:hypothetical protein